MSDLLLSPLNAWHLEQGAKMVPFADMSLPVQYRAGIKAEHLHTRDQASLFDLSHMVLMRLHSTQGIDAVLQAAIPLFPMDFSRLQAGQIKYSFFLDTNGGILDDIMISHRGDHLLIVGNGARRDHDFAHLQHSLEQLGSEVSLEVISDHALLALQGPAAAQALGELLPGATSLGFMQCAHLIWQQHEIGVFRQGYSGEDGFELMMEARIAEQFSRHLCKNTAIQPAGLGARDSLRLEAGLPLWGQDIDASVTPVEANLCFAIAKSRRNNADFPGAEAIFAHLQNEPKRLLCGLKLLGKQPARAGVAIHAENPTNDAPVGRITSGGFSPSLNAPIALAYLDAPHHRIGSRVYAEVRGKMLEAEVSPLPFVAHRYARSSPTK